MVQPESEIIYDPGLSSFLYINSRKSDISVAHFKFINDLLFSDVACISQREGTSENIGTVGEGIIEDLSFFDKAEIMEQDDERSRILEALSKNPTFRLPSKDFKGFSKFDPIKGTGIPASELIIQDRQ